MSMVPHHPSFFDYLFFLSFLFFVVIILMNLLIGLAVGDVAMIKERAEIDSYISQIEKICTAEAMLLNDPYNFLSSSFPFDWVKRIPRNTCCNKIRTCLFTLMRPFITFFMDPLSILVFHNKGEKKNPTQFSIKPNDNNFLGSLKVDIYSIINSRNVCKQIC